MKKAVGKKVLDLIITKPTAINNELDSFFYLGGLDLIMFSAANRNTNTQNQDGS